MFERKNLFRIPFNSNINYIKYNIKTNYFYSQLMAVFLEQFCRLSSEINTTL